MCFCLGTHAQPIPATSTIDHPTMNIRVGDKPNSEMEKNRVIIIFILAGKFSA